jgi:hypothetical protein
MITVIRLSSIDHFSARRTGKRGKTTEVGDEVDRREIWRMMDQFTGGRDVQEGAAGLSG